MGLIRGGLTAIASLVLFLLFFMGNIFLTLTWSSEYDTIQPELTVIIKELSENEMNLNEVMNENFVSMELYCQNNSEYVFNEQGYVFVIPCDVVSQGSEAVIEHGINNFIEQIYYKEYDCEFWDCIKETETPFVLVSEKAKDYWKSKFYFTLIISIILMILMFFLVEQKHSLFIIAGSLLVVSSLPFMKLNWVLSFISDESFLQFFTIFFVRAYNVFLINFIIGLAVLSVGIGLKFFGIGLKISNLFSKYKKVDEKISKKEVKKIVKQEVVKSKGK